MSTNNVTANAPFKLTYDTLVSSIQSYSQRSDQGFLDSIPEFIHLAQKKIASDFKTFWTLRSVNGRLVQGSQQVELPARWRKTVSLTVNGKTLTERPYEYVNLVNQTLPSGQPLHWAQWDYDNLAIAPVPDSNYTTTLLYYEQPVELAPSVQENLITREAPQLMLAGALLQSAFWLKDMPKIQYWQSMYNDAQQSLKSEDASRIVDRNTSPLPAGS